MTWTPLVFFVNGGRGGRPKSWAKTESNTQKAHKKIVALEALK